MVGTLLNTVSSFTVSTENVSSRDGESVNESSSLHAVRKANAASIMNVIFRNFIMMITMISLFYCVASRVMSLS